MVRQPLRSILKGKLPLRLIIGGQLFYLILFSYSFFIKGMTGLTIAIGSVATLAVLMKVTAGIDWNTVFVAKAKQPRQPAQRVGNPRYVPAAGTPPPPPMPSQPTGNND